MRTKTRFAAVATSLGLLVLGMPAFVASFQPDNPDLPQPGFEIETRGQVHEAFAQPNEGKPEAGVPIEKQPPPPLPELAPEQRPESDAAQWIPGYWAWDADRNDFVWISGTFRETPPDRRWVPGHWANTQEGWRWIPGFWAPQNQQDLQYAPEPPAPLEDGPAIPAPDDNSSYIPGYWSYSEQRYAWRPGYWAPYRPGRLWVSPRYLWTPNGHLFVNGYWDYPLEARGVLFAPVYFNRPMWATAGWSYRPNFVVSIGSVVDSCFYRPGSFHFYFGNYYNNGYVNAGYRPWWANRYDPHFSYYRWQHRADPLWAANHQRVYADRLAGRAPLPPRNFAQQNAVANNNPQFNPKGPGPNRMVAPLNAANTANPNLRLVANNQPVDVQKANIDRMRDLSRMRGTAEAGNPGSGPNNKMPAPNPSIARPTPGPNTQIPPQKDRTLKLPPATPIARLPNPNNPGGNNTGVNPGLISPTPKSINNPMPPISQPQPRPMPQPVNPGLISPTPKTINNPMPPISQPQPRPVPQPVNPGLISPTPKSINNPMPPISQPQPRPVPQPVNPGLISPTPKSINNPMPPIPQPQPRPVPQPVNPGLISPTPKSINNPMPPISQPQPRPVPQPVNPGLISPTLKVINSPQPQPRPVPQPPQPRPAPQPIAPRPRPAPAPIANPAPRPAPAPAPRPAPAPVPRVVNSPPPAPIARPTPQAPPAARSAPPAPRANPAPPPARKGKG